MFVLMPNLLLIIRWLWRGDFFFCSSVAVTMLLIYRLFTWNSCLLVFILIEIDMVLTCCNSLVMIVMTLMSGCRISCMSFTFFGWDWLCLASRFIRWWVPASDRINHCLLILLLLGIMVWSIGIARGVDIVQMFLIRRVLCWTYVSIIRVLIGSTGFLLVSTHGGEGEALSTFLIVCCRLRDLLLKSKVRIVVVLDACWSRCTWLNYDRIDILNMRYFDLLFSIFATWTSLSDRLWWIWAITSTTATHKSCIVTKLEAFIGFAWTHRCFMVRSDLTPCESLLKLRWPI